jgi:hypothetical protein
MWKSSDSVIIETYKVEMILESLSRPPFVRGYRAKFVALEVCMFDLSRASLRKIYSSFFRRTDSFVCQSAISTKF